MDSRRSLARIAVLTFLLAALVALNALSGGSLWFAAVSVPLLVAAGIAAGHRAWAPSSTKTGSTAPPP